jgi:hypothetical protein
MISYEPLCIAAIDRLLRRTVVRLGILLSIVQDAVFVKRLLGTQALALKKIIQTHQYQYHFCCALLNLF